MDVIKTLRELHQEKRRIDAAIASLEGRLKLSSATPKRRRGRKSMSAAERIEVSKRMERYWQARRAAAAALEPESNGAAAAAASGQPSA